MPREFESLQQFKDATGQELGTSDWFEITQDQVDLFAEATGDRQWIHVEPDKAAAGPFGGTIAHGYLTLSLLPVLGKQIYSIGGIGMGVNYGTNRVRFPHPVLVGSRVRGKATLKETKEIAIGTQIVVEFVIEIEGIDKPACVAEVISVKATARESEERVSS